MKRRLLIVCLLAALTLLLAACHSHDYGKWETKREATCTEDGKKVRECECGEEETKSIEATGHTAGEWVVKTAATCTQNGVRRQVCTVCDGTVQTEDIPATGVHTYVETITTAATCSNAGVKTFTCSGCQDTYTEPYTMPTYNANQIYENHLNSVGEIIVYDKRGNELALGSSFVYSTDGRIITNYHVIEGAYSATVTIGSTTYNIEQVLAYDKNIDVAVLKINATGLTPVTVCKEMHKVGDIVYAFGSSRGLTATFSDGIITSSNRVIDSISYTQHDAPISGGNSGGPLINAYGEVIGINTWTVRDSQNLNFAINIAELDKLSYATPMTFAEYYQKECNPFEQMKTYIMTYGSYDADLGWYRLDVDTYYSQDYSTEYTQLAYYIPERNVISLDFLVDGGDYWAYFEMDSNLSGSYYWRYFDLDDNEMTGTMNAGSFTSEGLLPYSDYTSHTYSTSEMQELASILIATNIQYISTDWAHLGITAADLGFYYF